MDKIQLLGQTPEQLAGLMQDMGEPKFRAKQVFGWLHKGCAFDEMKNLPAGLIEKLKQNCTPGGASIYKRYPSAQDDTIKYLFLLEDAHIIEGVLMHYRHGYTLCISSQAGCRMGCAFCASTLGGLSRNLTAGEMLGQVLSVNKELMPGGRGISNVVIMGSGEPLDNYDHTVRFLRLVNHPDGINIGLRNISLSSCGLVPAILRLADEGLPVTLSLSLHAPNDQIRETIMPVARSYPIGEILAAARRYVEKTGRRVIIEYILIGGINDSADCAKELASRLRGLKCHVNLIPYNPVRERPFTPPALARVEAFEKELIRLNISATRRREMGRDVQGACGQLRRDVLEQHGGGDRT